MSFSFNVFKICTTHCLFKLHIFLSQIKSYTLSAHITFVCLIATFSSSRDFPVLDAFSPRFRNHLGIPGWVFCLRRNFHSLPLVRVLSFFLRPGNTSFALVLFSGKMSVLSLQSLSEFLVYEGRMDPGFFD